MSRSTSNQEKFSRTEVIITSPRDYKIYTDWVNGHTQVGLANQYGLSANRIHQIVLRALRFYDLSAGPAYDQFARRTQHDRPTLYAVPADSGRVQLVASVVVVRQDSPLGDRDMRDLEDSFLPSRLSSVLRKMTVATTATYYLNQLLATASSSSGSQNLSTN